jgi:phosphoribosylanthranilate isomerase
MTVIKICGITSVEEAIDIAKMGADIIGLVFADSKRRVSLQTATEISVQLRRLQRRPAIAGVFVNEKCRVVNTIGYSCGLDIVQLSGDEDYRHCLSINYPIIKAIHVSGDMNGITLSQQLNTYNGCKDLQNRLLYLLDTKYEAFYGGSGKSFNWGILNEINQDYPVFIAGGLTPDNVSGLISAFRPKGVDVSSGVETGGCKDLEKIRNFINAVRSTPNRDSSDFYYKFLYRGSN